MHSGEHDLAGVLDVRLAEIVEEQKSLANQQIVCGEILAEGASYFELDVEKYLARLKDLSYTNDTYLRTDRVERPKADCPWRRFFARSLDLSIYTLVWHIAAYLGFHWNIGRNATGKIWLDLIVTYVLMLLIEPLLLAKFGATPGKFVFGIRVTESGGEKLTLFQGYQRLWTIIARGQGYVIVPGYNIFRMVKSYKACKQSGEMEWDEELSYVVKDRNPFRPVVFAICTLVLTAVSFFIPYTADMPKYRGEITARQFADNMNRSMRFHGFEGGIGTLPPDNEEYAALSGDLLARPPEIHFAGTNGFVDGVEMIFPYADPMTLWSVPGWTACGVNSFVGAQEGMNIFGMHFSGISRLMSGYEYDSYSFICAGVEVTYNVVIDGHQMSDLGYFLDNYSDSSVVSVYFSMRRIP
jgi:hypothetical protein